MNSGARREVPSAEVERARIEQQTQLIEQLTVPERKQYLELLRRAVLRQASQGAPAPPNPSADGSAPAAVVSKGVCPRCGRRPHPREEATYNNGIPTWHKNCPGG